MEGCVHGMPPSSKSMRTTQDEPGIRPALLQYMIGTFALALVCCSLLCIYFSRLRRMPTLGISRQMVRR